MLRYVNYRCIRFLRRHECKRLENTLNKYYLPWRRSTLNATALAVYFYIESFITLIFGRPLITLSFWAILSFAILILLDNYFNQFTYSKDDFKWYKYDMKYVFKGWLVAVFHIMSFLLLLTIILIKLYLR